MTKNKFRISRTFRAVYFYYSPLFKTTIFLENWKTHTLGPEKQNIDGIIIFFLESRKRKRCTGIRADFVLTFATFHFFPVFDIPENRKIRGKKQ